MPFIQCESLVKIYKVAGTEVFALQGLDMTAEAGEVLAIVGNSGSGKSTLMNILGGLDTPTAGRCSVDGLDLFNLTAAERVRFQREVVGFVWQNTARNLVPYLTALENVQLPMALAGQPRREARGFALDLLDAVGLKARANHRLTGLSGGEQQRVAIALALGNRPRLLLADEPTGSVDTATAGLILSILRDVNRSLGTTVVIVTHDRAVAKAADRYVLIRDGKVAQESVRRSAVDGGVLALEPEHDEQVVLDSAGRLQIPRELLAEAGITSRVKLELIDGKIQIRRP